MILNRQNLFDEYARLFPNYVEKTKEELEYNFIDDYTELHNVMECGIAPMLCELLSLGKEIDNIVTFLNAMADSEDDYVVEVFSFSFAEHFCSTASNMQVVDNLKELVNDNAKDLINRVLDYILVY